MSSLDQSQSDQGQGKEEQDLNEDKPVYHDIGKGEKEESEEEQPQSQQE